MTTSARDRRVPAYAATPTRALPVNQRSFSDAGGRCVYVIVGVGNYSCFYLVVHYTLRIVLATIDGDDSVHSRPNVSDQFDDLSCRTVKIEAWARYVFRHLTMKASRLVVMAGWRLSVSVRHLEQIQLLLVECIYDWQNKFQLPAFIYITFAFKSSKCLKRN